MLLNFVKSLFLYVYMDNKKNGYIKKVFTACPSDRDGELVILDLEIYLMLIGIVLCECFDNTLIEFCDPDISQVFLLYRYCMKDSTDGVKYQIMLARLVLK